MSKYWNDKLPFGPDPELQRVLDDIEAEDAGLLAVRRSKNRPKYYGRKFTNRLFTVRHSLKLTQAELARRTGSTRHEICAIETLKRAPSVYMAIALAQALEVKVEDIFELEPLTPVPPSKH